MKQVLISSTGEEATVHLSGDDVTVTVGEVQSTFAVTWDGIAEGRISFEHGSRTFFAQRIGEEVQIWLDGEVHRIRRAGEPASKDKPISVASGDVTASMPGMVVRVLVSDGDSVAEGDGILVLESMKMQLTLPAPRSGVVRNLAAAQGKMAEQGAVLACIEAEESV